MTPTEFILTVAGGILLGFGIGVWFALRFSGNIIHGHKEFDKEDDINITNSGNIFFRSLFHDIFR